MVAVHAASAAVWLSASRWGCGRAVSGLWHHVSARQREGAEFVAPTGGLASQADPSTRPLSTGGRPTNDGLLGGLAGVRARCHYRLGVPLVEG
ncbi:hypothetical protein HPP92_022241 [Vanilla planifolia]|uniref:Uncharacterized protein n=1 Tax=Vanilla planifolia TaxID=51239 RepID=A0A835UF86_VANPL|nr:hypothetical protein HPP92_022241 [Vanilla planifolia]